MKRANLHSIVFYTILGVIVAPVHGQQTQENTFVFEHVTLSDFGDGYDAAKSLVWKPKFSDEVVQVPTNGDANTGNDTVGNDNVIVPTNNPDPERAAVRYTEGKPEGITDVIAGSQKYVLGVKAEFTAQGYNYIELFPNRIENQNQAQVADDTAGAEVTEIQTPLTSGEVDNPPDLTADSTPYLIPFTGTVTDLSVWVWGGYYSWWVEAYIRDYLGYQYRLPLGDLLYTGWKQKKVEIPTNIVQGRKRLPALQSLTFEMLKLWSFPQEKVDKFYVYFDLLQHGSKISTEIFNGQSLEKELW